MTSRSRERGWRPPPVRELRPAVEQLDGEAGVGIQPAVRAGVGRAELGEPPQLVFASGDPPTTEEACMTEQTWDPFKRLRERQNPDPEPGSSEPLDDAPDAATTRNDSDMNAWLRRAFGREETSR